MSTEYKYFIEKYYDEFGDKCPFKWNEMGCDKKELEKDSKPKLEPDIPLIKKFFKATIEQLLQDDYFTIDEEERLIYLDQSWDIPKINFMYSPKYNLTMTDIFSSAADYGNLNVMKWLLKNKCPWNEETFYSAASDGKLDIMKWLLENKCPWNSLTPYYAAENGKLNALKWLLENKCPWDNCHSTAYWNPEIMEWLQKNNYM